MSRPKYYTTFQAAKQLGVSLATVVNWINAGLLTAHRTVGGHRRIAAEDLAVFARSYNMPIDEELEEAHGGPPRVLVVDDDEDLLATVKTMLEQGRGYQVETARSGFAAGLAVARFRPDAILLDIRMPGMDGFEVVRELRVQRPGRTVPVIACTGYADPAMEEQIRVEFDGLLEKPIDLDALLDAVALALRPG
jgi:excisionase family DNA binding protein